MRPAATCRATTAYYAVTTRSIACRPATVAPRSAVLLVPPAIGSLSRHHRSVGATRRATIAAAAASSDAAYDYDLFTIGAGSGGVRASRYAASTYGIKAAVCELPFGRVSSDTVGGAGGTCVLRGCVPKKLLVYASEYADSFQDAGGFGWRVNGVEAGWGALQSAKNKELDRLTGVYRRLLDGAGVAYVEGRGEIVDAHTVRVGDKTYTARHILVATGGRPSVPAFPGADLCLTSDTALDLPELPTKIAILGGGYIAVEFASIFNSFGVPTHLAFRADAPLRGFDEEVRSFATEQYAERGVVLHNGVTPSSVTRSPDGTLTLTLAAPGKADVEVTGLSHVMAATGRHPNTRGLGLDKVGVATDEKSGAIVVDAFSRTNVPSIWAVGDVTNRVNLTPVALMEGMAFARHVFGGDGGAKPDYAAIASAVFSTPTIASVGETEAGALKASSGGIDVYTSSFMPMKNTISGATGKSFMKLIVDRATDRVAGMHMVGPDAAEIMQGFAAAIKLGVTKAQLDSVVGIHPTAAEEFVTMRTKTRSVDK